jgi:hypothetical protein
MQSHLEAVNDAKLHGVINRLRRYELDFKDRLARRRNEVRDPDVPVIDPVYKRLSFTLRDLKTRRARIERELARRAIPS